MLFAGAIVTAASPLEQLRKDIDELPGLVAGGLVVAVYFAGLGLLAGAMTSKRVFAIGGLLAALLVTPLLSQLAFEVRHDRGFLAFNLALAPLRAAATILPGTPLDVHPPPEVLSWSVWAVVLLAAISVLGFRYAGSNDS